MLYRLAALAFLGAAAAETPDGVEGPGFFCTEYDGGFPVVASPLGAAWEKCYAFVDHIGLEYGNSYSGCQSACAAVVGGIPACVGSDAEWTFLNTLDAEPVTTIWGGLWYAWGPPKDSNGNWQYAQCPASGTKWPEDRVMDVPFDGDCSGMMFGDLSVGGELDFLGDSPKLLQVDCDEPQNDPCCPIYCLCEFDGASPPSPPPYIAPPPKDTASDKPCFGRDSYAVGVDGEPVAMASLRSGDYVMDGPASYTRVIVNQHRVASVKSSLLDIATEDAALSLTPDHVLAVDGKFAAARTVGVGSLLGEQEVLRVSSVHGEVINPLTASGKILTHGGILATTYPEWIADYMLSSTLFPLPISLSNALSFLFPEATQAYYDGVIESFVSAHHPSDLKAALPSPLIPAAFALGDLAVSAGFLAFSLASPMALVAVAAVAAAKARK